jgi:hypothetical protein
VTAAASFPVRRGDDVAGVLDLYAEQAVGDDDVLAAGQTLAAVVSACLTQAEPGVRGRDLVGKLEQALLARGLTPPGQASPYWSKRSVPDAPRPAPCPPAPR